MPYYEEVFINSSTRSSSTSASSGYSEFPVALDTSVVSGYRSRPHEKSVAFTQLSDQQMDPYAYFLKRTSERKYREALKARGLQPEGKPDKGHPFKVKRHTLKGKLHSFTLNNFSGSTFRERYQDAIVYVHPTSAYRLNHVHEGDILNYAPYKESGLDAFAQQAFARTAPTAAIFNAGEFLGELLEGLPHIAVDSVKNTADFMRTAGSGYLNVEFGWKPFISNLQDAGRALFHTTSMLSKQGKRVHRRFEQPPTTFSDSVTFAGSLSYQAGNWGFVPRGSQGPWGLYGVRGSSFGTATCDYIKTRTTTRWFEGEFTSYLPLTFNPKSYLDRLAALMDFRITPATLWELAPWSWLVDWQLHIGDSIAAAQLAADDKLILHYGYAMEDVVYETINSWRLLSAPTANVSSPDFPRSGQVSSTTTYRNRLRANPYGFRLGGTGALTGNQLNILGALGLTKAR